MIYVFTLACIRHEHTYVQRRTLTRCFLPPHTVQFFFFLLVIFAIEVAAGIWGFSNQNKVTQVKTVSHVKILTPEIANLEEM